MKTTRLLSLLLASGALVVAGFAAFTDFDPGGRIRIDGTSNVRNWHCSALHYTGSFGSTGTGDVLTSIDQITFTVPVSGIDCRNGTMTGKLRKALKSSANPTIRYTLQSARFAAPQNGRFSVDATGQVTIAGQTRPLQMTVQGQALGNRRYRFTGSTPLSMSNFGIERITALGGTMRVRDRVTVTFDVTVAR